MKKFVGRGGFLFSPSKRKNKGDEDRNDVERWEKKWKWE